MNAAQKGYQRLIRIGTLLIPLVLLIIRLAWGWELVESGWSHLHNVAAMTVRFQSWGVPMPRLNVYISGCTELIGGALLMIGFGTRLIAVPLIFNFCVAYMTASHATVVNFFHQDPSNFIDDAAFPFLILSLLMLAFGPGALSVDGILKRTILRHKSNRA